VNSEQRVIAEIDQLINESLQRGPTDDYNAEWHTEQGDLLCPVCHAEWHGLDNYHCPGAWATESQQRAFHEHQGELDPTHISYRWDVRPRRRTFQQGYAEVPILETTGDCQRVPMQPAHTADLGSYLIEFRGGAYLLDPHTPEAADVLARAPHSQAYLGNSPVHRLDNPARTIQRLQELVRTWPDHIQPRNEGDALVVDWQRPQYSIRRNP
jgi:hypothetical protein